MQEPNDQVCSYCLDPATAWDHVEPRSAGGTDDPSNLVPACKPCNSSKGATSLLSFVWRQGQGAVLQKRSAVRLRLIVEGIELARTNRDDAIVEMRRDEGATLANIATVAGMSIEGVRKILHKRGLK